MGEGESIRLSVRSSIGGSWEDTVIEGLGGVLGVDRDATCGGV